jgi:hypothetical protein
MKKKNKDEKQVGGEKQKENMNKGLRGGPTSENDATEVL